MKQTFKPRCGSRIYRSKEVCQQTTTFKIKSGQECELVGMRKEGAEYIATLYVFELKKYIERKLKEIEKYVHHADHSTAGN